MSISLSGTLTDPYGDPRGDATITFRAIVTSNSVLEHANAAAITDSSGSYAITVEFGRYNIEVKESGSPSPRIIAKNVLINGDTTAADLNQLVVDANGYDDLTPQIVVQFQALRDETEGYRDEAQASAQSASENATATAADRQAVADNSTHVDQQRQAVDTTADEVEADRLAAQTARTGAEDAQGASETARNESRAWATGDGVIDNISGTDRFSARVEADRAASERQSAESAATASSDSATLAGQRATTAGEHEAAAGDSATESSNWATYPIDTPVPEGDGSQYSSRHWAEIARQRAVNAMVAQGAWDASTGALPAEPVGASYWLVTGAPNGVTVEGVEYRNKDMLLWTPGTTSSDPGQWSKIDNTDSVVSVAGKSGAVELVPGDVGADPAGTAAQTMNDHVADADPHTQYVQKVTGKVLSTNDYTDAEKSKLSGIESGATQNATNAQLRDRSTHTGTQPLSTLSDAGSAAARDVGTSPGNVMEVGAFGIGAGIKDFDGDLDTLTETGFVNATANASNTPLSFTGAKVLHIERASANEAVQKATLNDSAQDRMFFRQRYSGVWGSWQEVLNTGTPDPSFAAMPTVNGDPIVESGSNSDGEWTRWADGSQISTAEDKQSVTFSSQGGLYKTGNLSVTYPMPFIDADYTRVPYNSDPNSWMSTGGSRTEMGTESLYIYSSIDLSGNSFTFGVLVCGRYK